MRRIIRVLGQIVCTGFLAGCSQLKLMPVAGGSGVEGTGLNDGRPPSLLQRMLNKRAPQAELRSTKGAVFIYDPLVPGERFALNKMLVTESDDARIRLPEGGDYTVGARSRVRFSLVGGRWTPILESGSMSAEASNPVSTPYVHQIVCETPWVLMRQEGRVQLRCSKALVRWSAEGGAASLSDAETWLLDEGRGHAARVP